MRTTEQYLGLIAPEHADKPKFVGTVALTVDVFARFQAFLATVPLAFDLDTAIGVQLDAVGVRVGCSRQLPYPLQGIFFTWGDPARGWGKGIWKGAYGAGVGLYTLDDETFRRLIRSKILANAWDGTSAGAQAILDAYFIDPETLVFIQDDGYSPLNQFFTWGDPARGWGRGRWKGAADQSLTEPLPMRMVVGIAGKLPSLIDLGLLTQGAFGVKPLGVSITYQVTSVNGAPLFGWGMDNAFVSGWGKGAWGVAPDYIRDHVIPVAA